MEFSDVGEHCHYELCQQQTYLPFECDECHHKFCRFHRTQETHECPKLRLGLNNNNNNKTSNTNTIIESKESVESDSKHDLISIGTAAKTTTTTTTTTKKPFKCKKKGCKKREWTSIKCDDCNRNYCIMHRNPDDHNCHEIIKNAMNNNNNNNGMSDIAKKRQSLINTVLSTFTSNDNNNGSNMNNESINLTKNRTVMVK